MNIFKTFSALLIGLLLTIGGVLAQSPAAYPTKQVNLMVPYPAARLIRSLAFSPCR